MPDGSLAVRPPPAAAAPGVAAGPRPIDRLPSAAWVVPSVVLVAVLALWAVLAQLIERERHFAEAAVAERATSAARVVEANLRRSFDAAEALLDLGLIETQFGQRAAADRAASPNYQQLRRLIARGHFGFLQVAAIGTDGRVLWSTVTPDAAPVDLSDRVHFREPMAGHEGLFFSEILIGRVSNRASMQISRRMETPDGAVLGVVVGSFDPYSLLPLFEELQLLPQDEALLIRDGGMVLSSSQGMGRVGVRLAPEDPIAGLEASGGIQRLRAGERTLLATGRSIAGRPLRIVVALDEAEAMAPFLAYRRDMIGAGWAATGFGLGLVAALAMIARRRARLTQAAVALSAAEQVAARFRGMAEGLGDLVLLHDAERSILYASPAAERLAGWQPAALEGEDLMALAHPEERGALLAAFAEAQSLGGSQAVAHRLRSAAGDWIWFETTVQRLSGGSAELISSSREVGSRIEAERRLQDAHARLNHLLSVAPVVLYGLGRDTDGRWRMRFVSPSVTALLGWEVAAAQLPGWWSHNVHPEDMPNVRAVLDRAYREGRAAHEYRFRRPDGVYRWLRDELRLAADGGEVIGCSVDVTEEHALRAQLVQASKLATLGEMATGMAHELNQPLAVIGTAAEALVERCRSAAPPSPAQIKVKLERILRMTHRAASIIDHMRVFGRISGEQLRAVALPAVVQGALTIVGPRLAMLGVALEEDWPDELREAWADLVPLEQVLLNLLTNACDAFEERPKPEAGRHIIIRGHDAGGAVVLTVQDNAGGIPEAALPRIFDPFFTTKPVGKGTGLGLAVSFGILRDLGGALGVENVEGGARFTLTLPIAA